MLTKCAPAILFLIIFDVLGMPGLLIFSGPVSPDKKGWHLQYNRE